MTTWAELAQEVWWTWGFHGPLDPNEVDYVLWEETAFPMADEKEVRRQLGEFFVFQAMPAPKGLHAGRSCCPMCGLRWWVTPLADCMLPSCGCFGDDTTADNPNRPCHNCGVSHARRCEIRSAAAPAGGEEAGS